MVRINIYKWRCGVQEHGCLNGSERGHERSNVRHGPIKWVESGCLHSR